MFALAIDLGGSHASAALLNEAGIVSQSTIAVQAGSFRDLLPPLERLVSSLLEKTQTEQPKLEGLAFGFPGAVDCRTSRVIATNQKFNDAIHFDFQEWAHRNFGCRLVLENDVRLALIGEHHRGAAQGADDAVMIALGTGIGTAAILAGSPLRGRTNQAGSLGGHLPVQVGGRPCTCGGAGCAEAEASTWALPSLCRAWPDFSKSRLATAETLDFRALFHAIDDGDAVAREIFARCLDIWTALAIAMTHAYSPQVIVFGGGVMARANDILPELAARIHREAWSPGGKVVIKVSALGSSAAFHAALPLLQEIAS